MKNVKQLQNDVEEISTYFNEISKINPNISKATIGWQIDHTFKVINGVFNVLIDSKEEDYNWTFNIKRFAVFLQNKIPRGLAKAPKTVQSYNEVSLNEIKTGYLKAKENLEKFDKLPIKSNFKHPFFGILNRNETIKFLKIHTQHHLKIIKDITQK